LENSEHLSETKRKRKTGGKMIFLTIFIIYFYDRYFYLSFCFVREFFMRTSNKYKNILQKLKTEIKNSLDFLRIILNYFTFYYKVNFFVRNLIKDLIFTSTMQKKEITSNY
jgi:hypothetical protein